MTLQAYHRKLCRLDCKVQALMLCNRLLEKKTYTILYILLLLYFKTTDSLVISSLSMEATLNGGG